MSNQLGAAGNGTQFATNPAAQPPPAGSVGTAQLADDGTTNAKLADMVEGTVKGRAIGAGTGNPTDLTRLQISAFVSPSLSAEGLVAQTIARTNVVGTIPTGNTVSGTVYFTSIYLYAGQTLTNALIGVSVAGVLVTMGKIGLYDNAGNLLASTANVTSAWESAGLKSHAFSAPYVVVTSGLYYMGVIIISTTPPQCYRGVLPSSLNAALATAIGAGQVPFGSLAGQTDLPVSAGVIVPGSAPGVYWIGLT